MQVWGTEQNTHFRKETENAEAENVATLKKKSKQMLSRTLSNLNGGRADLVKFDVSKSLYKQ